MLGNGDVLRHGVHAGAGGGSVCAGKWTCDADRQNIVAGECGCNGIRLTGGSCAAQHHTTTCVGQVQPSVQVSKLFPHRQCLLGRTKVLNILRRRSLHWPNTHHTAATQPTTTHMQAAHAEPSSYAHRVRNTCSLMGNSRWAVTSEGVLRLSLLFITPVVQTGTRNTTHTQLTHAHQWHLRRAPPSSPECGDGPVGGLQQAQPS